MYTFSMIKDLVTTKNREGGHGRKEGRKKHGLTLNMLKDTERLKNNGKKTKHNCVTPTAEDNTKQNTILSLSLFVLIVQFEF